MEIDIINETDVEIDDAIISSIQKAVETTLSIEKIESDGEVSVLFVDNTRIKELNKDYRSKDVPTDVLSFPQYESIIDNGLTDDYVYLGDVVISLDKAKEQAADFGHSLEREIVYLTVHSILHLLGYDHIQEDDKKIMREHEKSILKELKVFKS